MPVAALPAHSRVWLGGRPLCFVLFVLFPVPTFVLLPVPIRFVLRWDCLAKYFHSSTILVPRAARIFYFEETNRGAIVFDVHRLCMQTRPCGGKESRMPHTHIPSRNSGSSIELLLADPLFANFLSICHAVRCDVCFTVQCSASGDIMAVSFYHMIPLALCWMVPRLQQICRHEGNW